MNEHQKQLAVRIAENVTTTEREALKVWAITLLELRETKIPRIQKAKQALSITIRSNVIWPALKIITRQMKALGWDTRSPAQRFGLGGVAVALTFFSGSSAGIAALGGAIGVPLWIVFGAGAMFARYLYEELTESSNKTKD